MKALAWLKTNYAAVREAFRRSWVAFFEEERAVLAEAIFQTLRFQRPMYGKMEDPFAALKVIFKEWAKSEAEALKAAHDYSRQEMIPVVGKEPDLLPVGAYVRWAIRTVIAAEARQNQPLEKQWSGWGFFTPPGWTKIQEMDDGCAYRCDNDSTLTVIVSTAVESDGLQWLHCSMARPRVMPTYEDMLKVKAAFIGSEREAVQVFPRASKKVNKHEFCLHLFCCLEINPLPDFTASSGSL